MSLWRTSTAQDNNPRDTQASHARSVLLDTDVFSYLMKSDSERAKPYRPHVQGKIVAVSFVTVGELLFGSYKKKWDAAKVASLNKKLRSVLIVPYDRKVCETYGELKSKLLDTRKVVADNDLWIAACAVRHSIPLVSNNRKNFQWLTGFGLVLISEAPIIREIESQQTIPEVAVLVKPEPGEST
ncbi:MAG TPA: PIN domain-containing protein [Candidatus Angelobacter sp.]